VPWESKFHLLPQDSAGFSILVPSPDSRIVYVSASTGDDTSGKIYAKNSPELGADPFLPSGKIQPFKTIAKALTNARSGFPDWVLLQRGDTWTISSTVDAISGRSPTERSLIGAYGKAAARPLVRTGTATGVRFWKTIRFSAVVGISFYAHQRDPDGADFVGFGQVKTPSGFWVYADDPKTPAATVLIEDCSFRFYSNNVVQGPSPSQDIVVRRCQMLDDYSTSSHSKGMYTHGASVLLEENLFDHDGWYKQSYVTLNDPAEGQATFFNHDTYFTNTGDTIFRRNLFLRASSIGNKFTANPPGTTDTVMAQNVLLDNNLYVEGEIGVSAGGNTDNDNGYRFKNFIIRNNVLLDIGRGRPTNRSLGWGIDVNDWDGGEVSGNYFLHWGSAQVKNIYALSVIGNTRQVTIVGNVVHGLDSDKYAVTIDAQPKEQLVFSENQLQFSGGTMKLVDSAYLAAGTFTKNLYDSGASSAPFRAGGKGVDFAGWQAAAGDVGASFAALGYSDPGRTVESYMATLGKPATLDAFIAAAEAQSKQNWKPAYTAAAVNAYVRAGYAVPAP